MFGTEVIIIDPENEYKTLSDAVGGEYINFPSTPKTELILLICRHSPTHQTKTN